MVAQDSHKAKPRTHQVRAYAQDNSGNLIAIGPLVKENFPRTAKNKKLLTFPDEQNTWKIKS